MIGKVNLLCSLIYILLAGCSPRVYKTISDATYKPLDSGAKVQIYYVGEHVPDSARLIGKMEIIPSFTGITCQYDEMKAVAQEEAGKSGGNIVEQGVRNSGRCRFGGHRHYLSYDSGSNKLTNWW